MQPEIILASASPRRADLLSQKGISYRLSPENVLEKNFTNPEMTVDYNSKLKAESAAIKYPNHIILAADTIVYFEKTIFGKPKDLNEAFSMISKMVGKTHIVYTGVTIIKGNILVKNWVSKAKVTFKQLTHTEILDYLSLYNPLDKAGAYNIQEFGDKIILNVEGLASTVAGLPIEEVYAVLKKL